MGLPPAAAIALAALLGLLVGSFLNVVIHRLPRMMERQWAADCVELCPGCEPAQKARSAPDYNLMRPASACPHCGHAIRWRENVPVASWLALRGRCNACKARISARYPLVEIATAGLFGFAASRWGLTPQGAAWAGFAAALLALALIDWDTTLLPDDLTLPLLWAGLLAAALGWSGVAVPDAVWGAAGGYVSLWLVYWGFKLLTGKEGMGYGDFKLFAALGAWFGWQALIPLILIASVLGAAIGIAMKLSSGLREGGYVPFGPFLALGGLAALAGGAQAFWQALGL